MQTRNPLLNDFADLMTDAFGAAQAAGEEARAVMRAQADRFISEMDLVPREEFEAVKAAAAEAQAEVESLKARLDSLEAGLAKPAAAKPAKPATRRKPATASSGKAAPKAASKTASKKS